MEVVVCWSDLIICKSRTGLEFEETWARLKTDVEEQCIFVEEEIGGTLLAAELLKHLKMIDRAFHIHTV